MRTQNFFRLVSFLSIAAWAIIDSGQAYAQEDPCYTYSAIALEPSRETIETNAYFQGAGGIKHNATSTRKIELFGPVINTTGHSLGVKWNYFAILYKDPDGKADNSKVEAHLRSVDRTTGKVETIATLNSNERQSGTDPVELSTNFSAKLNFNDNYYYVQIILTRTKTTLAPEILGFKICNLFIP